MPLPGSTHAASPSDLAALEAAVAEREPAGPSQGLAEALRQLAIHLHHANRSDEAVALCRRSLDIAERLGDRVMAGQALNTLGGIHLMTGDLAEARVLFLRAIGLGRASEALCARVTQNLGIVANIQGDLDEAQRWYARSLGAYLASGDDHGCALAYHNLGMVSADRERLEDAERYYHDCLLLADRCGDRRLRAICLVNQAEVDVAQQRYENARQRAEEALGIFDAIAASSLTADAYRILGMVYRETGRTELAEVRLRQAVDRAVAAGSILSEAEATREFALLRHALGDNQEALRLLYGAHELFQNLDARRDLVHVGGHMAELEATYRAVVRAWGQSIESADRRTFGHCERVARTAVAVARHLALDPQGETTVLLGAWLHDLGMLRVPAAILAKPGPLTPDERAVVRCHPTWGVELLGDVAFPWDIRGIVRWHHERVDGSGYPDGLTGNAIPIPAQVVGIAEAYDALISGHVGAATSWQAARREVLRHTGWWCADVMDAFASASASGPDAND